MDDTKCNALKLALAHKPEPWVVSVEQFFDGNDDVSSIGWKLTEHPGMETFRDLLTGLSRRSDVQAVYARIDELDLGEDCWPSTDIFFVVGTILPDELRRILSPLKPDEVCAVKFAVPKSSSRNTRHPWWLRGGLDDDAYNRLPLLQKYENTAVGEHPNKDSGSAVVVNIIDPAWLIS